MFTREELREYQRRMALLDRWKAENPPPQREFSAVLADLSWLRSLASPEDRERDPDPEKLGIQKMRATLAALKPHHV